MHTIGINHSIFIDVLRQQDVVQSCILTDSAVVVNFEQQDVVQSCILTDSAIGVNFAQQNIVQTIGLSHDLILTKIYCREVCNCIDLHDRIYRNVDAVASNTLVLTDEVIRDPFVHTIGLTQTIVTNALGGDCCNDFQFYLPDKRASNTLVLTDSVTFLSVGNKSFSESLNLLQTVAYILASG